MGVSESQIEFEWYADPNPDVSYAVVRWNPNGTKSIYPSLLASPPFFDQNLPQGVGYGYQVMAVDPYNNYSDPSPVVFANTWGQAVAPVLSGAADANGVHLTWNDARVSDPNISGWDVLRAPGNDPTNFTSLLDGGEINVPTYEDTSVAAHQTYVYEVVALKHLGETSAPSNAVSVTTAAAPLAPSAPVNLQAGLAGTYLGTTRVGLHWDPPPGGALLGYDVYRSRSPQFVTDSTTLIGSSNDTGYTDDLLTGGIYYYVVKAVEGTAAGAELSSPASNEATIITDAATSAPNMPGGLTAPVIAADHVTLTWSDNSVNEAGFEIRSKPDGSPDSQYALAGRSTQDDAEFVDSSVHSGATYDYEVLAYNFGPNSSVVYSLPVGPLVVTTPTTGAAPAEPTALATDPTQTTFDTIALTWTAPSPPDGLLGYYVYRQRSDGSWLRLTTDPISDPKYTDANLASGSYTYRVTAVGDGFAQSTPLQGTFATPTAPAVRPTVQITAPAPFGGIKVDFNADTQTDGRIQKLTQVRAIVYDPNGDLVSWSLVLRPVNSDAGAPSTDIPLASGTTSVGSVSDPAGAAIYTLDPTHYNNGNYQLVLTASDSVGRTQEPAVVEVSLYSQTKLGNLTLPATDLQYTAPNGQSITVRRVYDSQDADVLGDFGYGWSLDLSQTTVRSTATPSSDYNGQIAFKPGDVVYITLPGGQQHAFQFWPVPTNFSATLPNPLDPTYETYWAQFVCVDGSNATLTVPGDLHDPNAALRMTLTYDRQNNVFVGSGLNGDQGQIGYDPANPAFGNEYDITTADGNTYRIAASTGKLVTTQDPNGNITTYSDSSIRAGGDILSINRNDNGTIYQIILQNAQGQPLETVTYGYDDAQNNTTQTLTYVQVPSGATTRYNYDTDPGMSHYLTHVISGGGNLTPVTTLTATYDSLGRLNSLTDAYGRNAKVGINSSDGSAGSQTATNLTDPSNPPATAAGTETIYDNQGNVARTIQTLTDAAGNLTGYSVTVHNYAYYSGGIGDELLDVFDPTQGYSKKPGTSSQNSLVSVIDYAPFVISGPDAAGLRYTQDPGAPLKEVDFNQAGTGALASSLQLPSVETDYLGDGSTRVTTFGNYVDGKPTTVTVTVDRGSSSQVVSSTTSRYDASGNLVLSFDALGQGTQYVYSDGTDPSDPADGNKALPKGLLLQSWRVQVDPNTPNAVPVRLDSTPATQNAYYTVKDATAGVLGSSYGKLKYSIDSTGRKTWYTYDDQGNVINTYTLWKNPQSGQSDRWVGTTNAYTLGTSQLVASYEMVYLDSGTAGVLDMNAGNTQPGQGQIGETPYAAFNGGVPLETSATGYDGMGRVSQTLDQYGLAINDPTQTIYDAVGQSVQTLNPDGTQTLSVYDPMGRVTWQTDAFYPGGPTPVLATHTIYDSQGRAIETDRYQGTDIEFTNNASYAVQTTQLVSAGTLISSTHTYYDAQGRTVETDDASGLRTGTIYYPDGQVQYSGVLNAAAALGGGSTGTFQTTDFTSYTSYLYNQFDTSTGKPFSGMLYDRTIDPDGHHTDTYKDVLGRTLFSVYDDGTYTQMLYGVGNQPVTGHVVTGQTLDGYQTTSIDPMGQATDSFYDRSGRLTDVYQPAVADALNNNVMTRPHWHYTYDQSGDELSQTDPKGNTTTFTYNERGNKLSRTLPGNQSESWTYDQFNRVVTHVDMNGHTSWEVYADAPQFANQQGLDGSRLLAEYRYSGSFTPPTGTTTSPDSTNWVERTVYVYDDGITDPANSYLLPSAEQTHLGRVAEVEEWTKSGSTETQTDFTHTTFDAVTGQPSSITSNEGTINYTYDPATGRKVRMWTGTDPANAPDDTAYGYDSQGRLASVYTLVLQGTRYATYTGINSTTHSPTFTVTPLTVAYTYDAAGNLKTETQSDPSTESGQATTYTYDDLNRLTDLATQNTTSNEPVFAEHYDLRADGLKQDVIDTRYNADGSVFSKTQVNWMYDGVDRLTSEALTVLAGGANAPAVYSDTFSYDLDSNRVGKSHTSAGTTDTTTSAYNTDGELTQTVDSVSGTTNFSYDANGSQTNDGTHKYVYDLRNRLVQVAGESNNVIASYTYDDAGNRVRETTSGVTTYFVIDTNSPTGSPQVIEAKSSPSGTPSVSYIFGKTVIGQASGSGTVSYLLTDGQGSTRATINSTGTVTATFNYDAFGGAIGFNPASAGTIFLYGGDGMYDTSSGLYFHGSGRQSDNRNDRFIEADPPGYGSNLYLLDSANAVNVRDPSGHESLGEVGGVGAGNATLDSIQLPSASGAAAQAVQAVESARVATSLAMLLARGFTYFGAIYGAATTLRDGANAASSMIEQSVDDAIWTEVLTHALHHQVLGPSDVQYLRNLSKENLGRDLYLHYSFISQASSFANGLWGMPAFMPPGNTVSVRSYATKDVYATGWQAHWYLALPSEKIQDAEYIVLPKQGITPIGPSPAAPGLDAAGNVLDGGGGEYLFPEGSGGPGTVFGPIPIPIGVSPSVQN